MRNLLSVLIIVFLNQFLLAGEFSLNAIKNKIELLVKNEASIELSVATCKPDKRITHLMEKIDSMGQLLMSQEEQTDELMKVSEKCLVILATLRERRIYAYMLWAEGCIEGASSGRYADLKSLNQAELMKLYEFLSMINTSIVKENMLNREIISRLADIYDALDNDHKPQARIHAIQQQRDSLSTNFNVPVWKTLDDF